ncbi:Abhydrolase domain-containing protein mpaH [Mycena kentingensis (nom. inval.)]|nr:Abhydrolase domain-containing protein mpaH [Mycena kentingensis (nom. inval.)]
MLEAEVTYLPTTAYPFHLHAKRYWVPAFERNASDPDALTLLFFHATSFHKETWVPTIERLFDLAASEDCPVKIREAWCLDCPNHGRSASMNANALLQPEYHLNFSCERYAQAIHQFLSATPYHAPKIDFKKRNLVGIGHSLGGVAVTFLQDLQPTYPFSSLILIEPLLSPAGGHHLHKLRELLVKGAYERRDVWPDRAAALEAVKSRERVKKWHPAVVESFVQYGIVEHPGARYLEGRYPGVTLACTREQEAAMYRDPDGATKPIATLNRLCRTLPGGAHLILGGVADFVPKRVHKAIREGRSWASVNVIQKSGHLMVQEVPDELAQSVLNALRNGQARRRRGGEARGGAAKSRL